MQEDSGDVFLPKKCLTNIIPSYYSCSGQSIYSAAFAALSCNLLSAGIMAGVCQAPFSLASMAAAKMHYVYWSWLEGSQAVTQLSLCGSIAWLEVSYQRIKLGELSVKEPSPADCRLHWQGQAGQDDCKSSKLNHTALFLKYSLFPFQKICPLVVKQESSLQDAQPTSCWSESGCGQGEALEDSLSSILSTSNSENDFEKTALMFIFFCQDTHITTGYEHMLT